MSPVKKNDVKNKTKPQKNAGGSNSGNNNNIHSSSIISFFKSQQVTQNSMDDSFSSLKSFDSSSDKTMIDPPILPMVSVLENRKKELEERKNEISLVQDEKIRKILLDMANDIKNAVEDNERLLQSHNELLNRHYDDAEEIQSNRKSINNLSKGIGNLTDGLDAVKNRVQSLEITKNCAFDSFFLNLIIADDKDVESLESGITGPKEKFSEILSSMKIVPPKDICDSHLMTVPRFRNGKKKHVKILRTRFNDSLTAGRIFSQVIKHNRSLADGNRRDEIKYFAEMPASRNVWNLKRICYQLKNEGCITNVRGSERGILVTYKINDSTNEFKEIVKTCVVTSVKDIDDLRKELKVVDAYMSVSQKYNDEFWSKQNKKSEIKQKRGRELDENEECVEPKRISSSSTQYE